MHRPRGKRMSGCCRKRKEPREPGGVGETVEKVAVCGSSLREMGSWWKVLN